VTFPLSYSIQHAVYEGSTDDDGYSIAPTYGDPVTRKVYGWYPQTSEVPVGNDELTNRVIASIVVMVPDISPYSAGDLVAFPGGTISDDESAYRVSRDVRDFNNGPFGYKPGGEIVVERVRG
jgi:hypothetical protein